MSEPISRDVVAHVANLARIELADDEIDHFTGRLARVLEHAAEIEGLDLDDVRGETAAHNVPGTIADTDWSRRAAAPVESLSDDARVARTFEAMTRE